ncbi:MAG: GyrI-like domain-containing protein [Ilumatobacteraceae bacterium]
MTPPPTAAELIDIDDTSTAVIRGVVPVAELADFFDRSFSTLATVTSSQDIAITGPAFALYHGAPSDAADLEVGVPTEHPVEPTDGVQIGSRPAGRAARLVHHGSYDELGSSWQQLERWMRAQGLEPANSFWEVYVTEPTAEMDPADLRTELIWPVSG